MRQSRLLFGCFILFLTSIVYCGDTLSLGFREYRTADGEWYNYSAGSQGDKMDIYRLIVRKSDRTKPTLGDFSTLKITGVEIGQYRVVADYYTIIVDSSETPQKIASIIFNSSIFDYVEFDPVTILFETPSDTYFDLQWAMQNDKMRMESVWDTYDDQSSVSCAIIDNGVNYNHGDVIENIWINQNEIPAGIFDTVDTDDDDFINSTEVIAYCSDYNSDGVINLQDALHSSSPFTNNDDWDDWDDNNTTYVDDIIGWNGDENNNDPLPTHYHGTSVAGIVGANTNNSLGVSGVAGGWDTHTGIRLMIYKPQNHGLEQVKLLAYLEDMTHAYNNGCDIINMSWGVDNHYTFFEDDLQWFSNAGVILVAASGNEGGGTSPNDTVRYPARYSSVIGVGATVNDDSRWTNPSSNSGSCYGPDLSVTALGGNSIYTLHSNGGYNPDFGGTSAAAPHVTGIAGLIRSIHSDLAPSEVKDIIEQTADKVDGMEGQNFHNEYGYGRVNAYRAVQMAQYMFDNDIDFIHSGNVSGTISENSLLAGEVTISSDLQIASGTELHIYKGTSIKVSADKAILVYGDIIATGTSTDPILLTSTTPGGDQWWGVEINSGASITARYTTFDNMERGYL